MRNHNKHIFRNIAALLHAVELPSPKHPLIAVLDYSTHKAKIGNPGDHILLNFYKISFKTNFRGQVMYGHHHYDFDDGGMAFIAPNQLLITSTNEEVQEGFTLYVHPDFFIGYPLARKILQYGFFHYDVSEALYLSVKEKDMIAGIFNALSSELNNNIDAFSQDILISQIEQLLNYCNRFYTRQFITRSVANHSLLTKMEKILSDYVQEATIQEESLPTVKSLAEQLQVSPHYLSDMLRSLTGLNTQQHIHLKVIEKAKNLLITSEMSVAEIAYTLGFEHPQSFSKLFRRKVDCSPVQFRERFFGS